MGTAPSWTLAMVKTLRRTLLALVGAGLLAGVVRRRTSESTPRTGAGWRELSGPDLR